MTIVGNLGSDADTTVFATSNGTGSSRRRPMDRHRRRRRRRRHAGGDPLHPRSRSGLQPGSVSIIGDNISWTYSLTVPPPATVRLAYFTIVATTRSQADGGGRRAGHDGRFSDQAGTYLTPEPRPRSIANFVFPGTTPPAITSTSPALTGGSVAAGTTSLGITFSKPVLGAATVGNYQLQSAGADGLLGTADDVIIPITASYHGAKASLVFAPLMENVYRLTVHDTITDLAGNALQGSGSGGTGDWTSDFVVIPSNATVYAPSPYATGG